MFYYVPFNEVSLLFFVIFTFDSKIALRLVRGAEARGKVAYCQTT